VHAAVSRASDDPSRGWCPGPGAYAATVGHGLLRVLSRHLPPPDRATHLLDQQATRAQVLESLTRHRWVHLACHGRQRYDAPVASAFSLWDGDLAIRDLAGVRHIAGFAFLSECQPRTGSARLADEAFHLTAALLVLGGRQVVGTRWRVAEGLAPAVVDEVYRSISTGAVTAPTAATALHDAVEALRAKVPADPLIWHRSSIWERERTGTSRGWRSGSPWVVGRRDHAPRKPHGPGFLGRAALFAVHGPRRDAHVRMRRNGRVVVASRHRSARNGSQVAFRCRPGAAAAAPHRRVGLPNPRGMPKD